MGADIASKIIKYADNWYPEPGPATWYTDRHIFDKLAYSRWAAYEIASRIMDNPHENPGDIVEDFIFDTMWYAHISRGGQKRFIFETALDVAEDILCNII